jgi:hypothetical protein
VSCGSTTVTPFKYPSASRVSCGTTSETPFSGSRVFCGVWRVNF